MSDAPVSLPVSLTALKIEIGKNILRTGLAEFETDDDMIDMVMARAPDGHHIDAADKWRMTYPEATRQIEIIARRAIAYCTDRDRLVASLMSDMYAACSMLDRQQHAMLVFHIGPILQKIISTGATPEAKQCLEALAAYGRGE